mmetsp:Transcript_12659/g.34083  ORF Transcript_12659/g.34083 Transcript_12659/m.34083 type:complete len:265 (-) Transcript_12659:92-886(-)
MPRSAVEVLDTSLFVELPVDGAAERRKITVPATVYRQQAGAAQLPMFGSRAVVLHPHPKLGGCRFDPVVHAVSTALAKLGFDVVAPDVGVPGFASWSGCKELLVVEEILRQQSEQLLASAEARGTSDGRLIVCGYSFGAALAVTAAAAVACVHAVVSISYPAGWLARPLLGWLRSEMNELANGNLPLVLLVTGDSDFFCSLSAAEELSRQLNSHTDRTIELCVVENVGHFWPPSEHHVISIVVAFVEKHFGRSGSDFDFHFSSS